MSKVGVKNKKILLAAIPVLCVAALVIALVTMIPKSFSAQVQTNITVPSTTDVTVYVGGMNVEKTSSGYYAPEGETVTLTVINENKLFESMTVGGVTYTTPIAKVTVPSDGTLDVTVTTTEPYAENKGEYFGNPYMFSDEEDVLALSRILDGKGTASDFARFGEDVGDASTEKLRVGYFRVKTNLFVTDEDFGGIGSRKHPFGGCVDFAGSNISINITRTAHRDDDFYYVDEIGTNVADYGFFSVIYGDGVSPCLVRNADVRGTVAVSTLSGGSTSDAPDRINAGGIAGTAGKNIVFDGISSQVSVSMQTKKASLYLGGLIGFCSSPVESWCTASYEGLHSNVSGVTRGTSADVYSGGFAGIVENSYVNNFLMDVTTTTVLANSLGEVSGSASSGGLAGAFVVENSDLPETSAVQSVTIKNITFYLDGEFSITSVVDNSASKDKDKIDPDKYYASAGAISGGTIGILYRTPNIDDDNIGIYISNIVTKINPKYTGKEEHRLKIRSQTLDGNSSGTVFAGGTVGYVFSSGADHFFFLSDGIKDGVVPHAFECGVDIEAVQNGIGPAYAGGYFGYNAFVLPDVGADGKTFVFRLCRRTYDYTVTAMQSASSTKVSGGTYDSVLYEVCAGGYSAKLRGGYSASNKEYILGKSKIGAYREVGSTAIGDVAAGGYVGIAAGSTSKISDLAYETPAGKFENMKIVFEGKSTIEACGYSFDSRYVFNAYNTDKTKRGYGNNVYAGGFAGFAIGYESMNNITVDYTQTSASSQDDSDKYFVRGVQDAVSGHNDLKSEGYVGGVFGLLMDCPVSNVNFEGSSESKALIYFESSNDPDTASVGGLAGAVWSWYLGNTKLIDGASIKNAHIVGKAYSSTNTTGNTYDIYVGGAIGVFANGSSTGVYADGSSPSNSDNEICGVTVENCVVEAIGEDKMLTYAAGLVGGLWWKYGQHIKECKVIGTDITASSISQKSYAGGIVGIAQSQQSICKIVDCIVYDSNINAISKGNETSAAGIFSWGKDLFSIENCYSNATIKSSGVSSGKSYYAGVGHPPWNGKPDSVMQNNYFVSENAGCETVYLNLGRYTNVGGAPLHLVSYGKNEAAVNSGETLDVYPQIGTADSTLTVKSADESVAKIEQNDDGTYRAVGISKGVAYISVNVTIGGTEYVLCSYPVIVDGGIDADSFGLDFKNRDGDTLSASDADEFYADYESGTSKYTYVLMNVGNPNITTEIGILPSGTDFDAFPVLPKIYEVSVDSAPTDTRQRIAAILAAKSKEAKLSDFNGRLSVLLGGDSGNRSKVTLRVSDMIESRFVAIIEFAVGGKTYGLIAEYVPNEIESVTITPSENTPPLDSFVRDGREYFVYSPGDVVRFNTVITGKYPTSSRYVVETEFSGEDVKPNGSLVISEGSTEYVVTCSVIGKNDISSSVYIVVRKSIAFDFGLFGANVSSDRKMAEDTDFEFRITPQIGYGLKPEIGMNIGGVAANVEWIEGGLSITWGGNTYFAEAEEDSDVKYTYDITLPADLTRAIGDAGHSVTIGVTYQKKYTIVFMSNFGANDMYMLEVPAGAKFAELSTTELDAWIASHECFGYTIRGLYRVSRASSLSAYGKSFEEMRRTDATVSGSMRFHIRRTYDVVTETPANVSVKSGFSAGLCQDTLVPIDTDNGFSFVISTPSGWVGTPKFDVYVKSSDGNFTKITDEFESDTAKDGYVISAQKLAAYTAESGYLQIVVYSDALRFYVGDDAEFDYVKLRSDGIFSVEYTVNYGTGDTDLADISYSFGTALPKGTGMRLFYRKDGKTVMSGGSVLTDATREVRLSDFASLSDGTLLGDEMREGAVSEKFTLVVTLPNNSLNFEIASLLVSNVSMERYKFVPAVSTHGSVDETAVDSVFDLTNECDAAFMICPAKLHIVTAENKTLVYSIKDDGLEEFVDYRHTDARYMWKIEKTGGGMIADDVTFDAFGEEIVRTTVASFFMASPGSVDVSALTGYTVSLVEVRNVRQPAEGLVLYSFAIE